MYIGPWQEYKLARILQLKDKVDKEERENNKLDTGSAASGTQKGQFNVNDTNRYANSEGFKNMEIQSSHPISDKYTDNGMTEPGYKNHRKQPRHGKNKPMRHRSHNIPKPRMQRNRNLQNVPQIKNGMNNNYVGGKGGQFMNGSPTSNNTNYSSKVIKSTANSFKNIEKVSTKTGNKLPSNRTIRAGSNDKLSYMNSTNNSEARSYASQMVHEMRKNNFFNNFNKGNINR